MYTYILTVVVRSAVTGPDSSRG